MLCKHCFGEMEYLTCHDDISSGYAYNLYFCHYDGVLAREDMWNDERVIWMEENGEIVIYKSPCNPKEDQ